MRLKPLLSEIRGMFDVFDSARAVSAAVQGRRSPRPRDLVRLGIDPEQFSRIGRY